MSTHQPKALYVLFLTEMWERFGYFTMVTIFVLYLTNELNLPDERAFLIFGAYSSFIYLTPVAGGILADRLIGFRAAILVGAPVMAAGYLLLQVSSETTMYVALGLLVVGNGFFKPNTSALLGRYYGKDEDARRDAGYTLLYMGINLGGLLGALVAGIIVTRYSYGAAFAAAGIGKLIAFATFYLGRRFLEDHGRLPAMSPLADPAMRRGVIVGALVAGSLGTVLLAAVLLRHGEIAGALLAIGGSIVTGVFLFEIVREEKESRPGLWALVVLIGFAVVFFAVYSQSGSSVNLYTERAVNLDVGRFSIPPSDVQSLNPLFILLLGPVFAWIWLRASKTKYNPPVALKFALGLIFVGAAYLSLRLAGLSTGGDAKVNLTWMVGFYLLYTMGELSLSPVGLSTAARLPPARLSGFAMGMWYLATAAANFIGGIIAGFADVPSGTSALDERHIYEVAFTEYGLIALGAALVLLALTPALHRMMKG